MIRQRGSITEEEIKNGQAVLKLNILEAAVTENAAGFGDNATHPSPTSKRWRGFSVRSTFPTVRQLPARSVAVISSSSGRPWTSPLGRSWG